MPVDLAQSLENLKLERDAIQLYDALASIEKDPRRASAFRTIAGNERRHADVWANRLGSSVSTVPAAGGPRFRVRAIIALARLLGTHAVRDLVLALEGDEEDIYTAQGVPGGRSHRGRRARACRDLEAPRRRSSSGGIDGAPPRRGVTGPRGRRPSRRCSGGGPERRGRARRARPRQSRRPPRSRRGSGGTGRVARARCGRSSSASATGSSPTSPCHGRCRRARRR